MIRITERDDKLELFLQIKSMISEGTIRTKDISKEIRRSERQTRRYFRQMGQLGMLGLTNTSRVATTQEQVTMHHYNTISKNEFLKIPQFRRWINGCLARNLNPETIKKYLYAVRYIFSFMDVHPSEVLHSRETAINFWIDFIAEFKRNNPTAGTHNLRVSYKNFLASHGITFANNIGKIYGLSSSHDRTAPFAGVYFTNDVTKKIGQLILNDGDFALYVWFRLALRTGARPSSLSTMTWDRVYWNYKGEDDTSYFKLEQHETKDRRGHIHLGRNGEWKTKYLPPEIKSLLIQWRKMIPDSPFLWFPDGGSDTQNLRSAARIRRVMTKKLRSYYEQISDQVDPLTRQYMLLKPHHVLRHTLVQQMKNAGLSNDDIADSFGWRAPAIVGTWYSKTSEKRRQEITKIAEKVSF